MSVQAQPYSSSGGGPPLESIADYSFSFERVISPSRRPPSLPQAKLQPSRLWNCSPEARHGAQPARAGERIASQPARARTPRLPVLQPVAAAKIDALDQFVAIPPVATACLSSNPIEAGAPVPPQHAVASPELPTQPRARSGSNLSIPHRVTFWLGQPGEHTGRSDSQVQLADTPALNNNWPVISSNPRLSAAPLFERQIERERERRRNLRKSAAQARKRVILPDRAPEPALVAKGRLTSFHLTQGMKRWLAAAASVAAVALGAVRFGPDAIDALSETLEPRAAFVFFDDPATGVGPWWPPGNFIETEERTFTIAGLALNRCTVGRGDLRFDFDVKIGPGGFGWLAGAKDEKNYLAYRLTVKGRRKKEYVLVRYPVVDGGPDAERRDEFPVSADLLAEDFNKFSVRVRGDKLTVLINGQGVDYWTNPGAVRGGVGFFTEKGDNPLIRSVRVDGNDDFTGLMARGTIDTLQGVREILVSGQEPRENVAGGESRGTDPTD